MIDNQRTWHEALAMQNVKQIIHDIADHLPEQAALNDTVHALYVRHKLGRFLQVAKEGKVNSQDEMERHFMDDARREFLL
jgi:hypothetical protein